MSEIDELSRLLGSIEARLAQAERHDTLVTGQLKTLTEELRALREDFAPVKATVGEMEPEVDTLRKLRNRGIGLLIGVGLAAGGTSIGVLKAVESWLHTGP